MKTSGILALAILLTTTGAAAKDPPAESPTEEKKICRSETVTGSRTRVRKICKTEQEWRELARHTALGMDRMGNRIASGQGQLGAGAISLPTE